MQNNLHYILCGMMLICAGLIPQNAPAESTDASLDLWNLASKQVKIHRFATLFTAQDMRDRLSNDAGIEKAIDWCHATGVTHVFLETFRDGYQAPRETMIMARDRFKAKGFIVSGCVTTTKVGKPSTASKDTISCYTDSNTQNRLKSIFEFTAGLFDEIMIDDFWFTDCKCPDCTAARLSKTVKIGSASFPVSGETWEDYRCELMVQLSRLNILAAAKAVNPKCKVIIKYPQWYDQFQDRGYEVVRETADFDRIWVGTETRDYTNKNWGGTPQYEGFFIMRWLGGIGGSKCGGGWFDWLGTTEQTYVEQARQTILGGARESFLFCYGGLQGQTGPKNVAAFRANVPELITVAKEVSRRKLTGIAAYKPANSHPEKEARVFDFVGMLGLPLNPCHEFPAKAPAAFFSIHALKDPNFLSQLKTYLASKKPVLLTDGLAKRIEAQIPLNAPNIHILTVSGDPKSLLNSSTDDLAILREPFLKPFKTTFKAPNGVSLYLFTDHSWVIENFNDVPAFVDMNGQTMEIEPRGWKYLWK
jgi:hypothetical protein